MSVGTEEECRSETVEAGIQGRAEPVLSLERAVGEQVPSWLAGCKEVSEQGLRSSTSHQVSLIVVSRRKACSPCCNSGGSGPFCRGGLGFMAEVT